jgi:hypothetical protein
LGCTGVTLSPLTLPIAVCSVLPGYRRRPVARCRLVPGLCIENPRSRLWWPSQLGRPNSVIQGKVTDRCFPPLAIVQQHPIIYAIFDLASVFEDFCEQLAEKVIIRGFLEPELPDVVEIDRKLL